MKALVVTIALLAAGVAFLAPPLIAVLPVVFIGLFLMASPMMINSLARSGRDEAAGAGTEQRPAPGPAAR
jgi:hypothetical protein